MRRAGFASNGFQLSLACSLFIFGRIYSKRYCDDSSCWMYVFGKKLDQAVQRDFNCKLSSCKNKALGWVMFILCTLLISFERSGKLTNKIPYQLIMLPFLCPVSKWYFTHKEYNKQYAETYLDEIQEWIEYLSTKYVLCRFDNHSIIIFIDVFKIWASSRRKVQYCGLTRPFASSPDFCYNKWGL